MTEGALTVSLPMYQPPELAALTDSWWQGLARHFRAAGIAGVPDALTRPGDLHAHWRSPALLFSQSCGYPLTHAFAGCWQLVATPCYAAPGCEGPYYRSLLIVRADAPFRSIEELRGRTACFNSRDSHSGHNILRATIAPLARGGRFFGRVLQSGGHIHSAAMVQRGEADLAALDCVSHALYARHAPQRLEGTRVLCRTAPAPALPYITAAATDPLTLRRLRDGLQAALADPALADLRAELLIEGASLLPDAAYSAIAEIERQAVATGYPDLG
ncbi:MAG: PhnD/SsuA/transferrin family substrate-binding protein [Alphaproteobacteria bacterium]|nr:PhnD/SsuA/transferrin family substrate-binding protein [Alphaproteobacteria bacterium]